MPRRQRKPQPLIRNNRMLHNQHPNNPNPHITKENRMDGSYLIKPLQSLPMHNHQITMIHLHLNTRRSFPASTFPHDPFAPQLIIHLPINTPILQPRLELPPPCIILASRHDRILGEEILRSAVAMVVFVFHADEHGGFGTQGEGGDRGAEGGFAVVVVLLIM